MAQVSRSEIISEARLLLDKGVEQAMKPKYEPTGIQEDIIIPFGWGKYDIILVTSPNKVGKTRTAVEMLKNVFWRNDLDWFDYPAYSQWPYYNNDGKPIKTGRITGTVKNTADSGPIRQEILSCWPMDRYKAMKGYKSYYSQYETDTQWVFDVMTYEQSPDEFEGPLLSWVWSDEPPPDTIVGAINSRFQHGGIWLITATPVRCGMFLDVLDDLEERGKAICRVTCDITDNDKDTGKPNHKGTKRGLMTKEEIDRYSAGIPEDEKDARLHGKASNKSGKIYGEFTRHIHVDRFHYEIDSELFRMANCYHVQDPTRRFYPANIWVAMLPDGRHVVYNEWPTKETLGVYYDEVRHSMDCPYTPEEIGDFCKVLDGTHYGLTIFDRFMDPYFASGAEYGRKTETLLQRYAKAGIRFKLPQRQLIDVQRNTLQQLLKYNHAAPLTEFNRPGFYVMPHCENTIRALERHGWAEGKDSEAERYKDFVDCIRIYLAGVQNRAWESPKRADAEPVNYDVMPVPRHYTDDMADVAMG